jgi:phospholipid/cholesterol/gamma-HCH transport system permease protein
VTFLRNIGASALFLSRTLAASARSGLSIRECVAQAYEVGNRSAWLVGSGMVFFGAVMVSIANLQAKAFVGNLALVGPAFFELMVREFGPITSALLCAACSGAGSSAELASMAAHEQVEAIEMSAGDPLADLVAPRLIGAFLAIPALALLGTAAACLSAVATASWVYGSDGLAFIDPRYVDTADLLSGGIKSVLNAVFIPLAAALRGLAARGGSAAVGDAVTRGVVEASLGVMVIDIAVALGFMAVRA